MDKIILTNKDIETLLKWRDENINKVRRSDAPFKGIILEFPESKTHIKAINDAGRITFYVSVNGQKIGKLSGRRLPGGYYDINKNTTKLKNDDIQSIITVYASLMALIVHQGPRPATAHKHQRHQAGGTKKQSGKKGITYLFRTRNGTPILTAPGHHNSPAGSFSVRGHYRHYKSGRIVWIPPYQKGQGKQKNKTYKL